MKKINGHAEATYLSQECDKIWQSVILHVFKSTPVPTRITKNYTSISL